MEPLHPYSPSMTDRPNPSPVLGPKGGCLGDLPETVGWFPQGSEGQTYGTFGTVCGQVIS